jgi:hypothetical protein
MTNIVGKSSKNLVIIENMSTTILMSQTKIARIYYLNQIVLSVDKGKTVDHNYCTGNCLKSFVNEI